jgi:hypothetical protein
MLKRAASAKEIYRFEKTGFPAAVGAIDNIGAWMADNLDAFKVSYLQNIQL